MPEVGPVRLAGLRYLVRHRWLGALSILGVALGVAVVVAVDLANASAQRAFSLAVEGVSGRTTHRIVAGPGGVPQSLYRELALSGQLPTAAPVIEATVATAGDDGRTFRLLGVDPVAEAPFRDYLGDLTGEAGAGAKLMTRPATVLLDRNQARRMGVSAGESLTLVLPDGRAEVRVAGLFGGGARTSGLLIADIATAQELLGRYRTITRIDLILPDGAAGRQRLEALRRTLPEGLRIEPAGRRSRVMREMTRAFTVNLDALSLLALVVGMFLIYNTMTFAVVQRRELFGILRAIGVGRGQIAAGVLLEALAVGAVGTLLGIVGGRVLAEALLAMVTRTINDLYFVLQVGSVTMSPASLAKGIVLGVGATVAAAAAPAVEAARVTPRASLSRSELERRARRALPALMAGGVVAAAVAVAVFAWPSESLAWAYTGLLFLVAAVSLWVPPTLYGSMRALAACLPARAMAARMAVRGVTASLSRTAVAVAALTVALATTVGVGSMIESFRDSVSDWLRHTLTADLYVSPAEQAPPGAALPGGLADRLAALRGVARVTRARSVDVEGQGGPVRVNAFDLHRAAFDGFDLRSGDPDAAWRAFRDAARNPPGVLVSEPLAYHRDLAVGGRIRLHTAEGWRAFEVLGVYRDYGSDRGRLAMSLATYRRYWDDPALTGIGVYTAPGSEQAAVARRVHREAAGAGLVSVRSNREIREYSLRIFDRTFAVTAVLRLLAMAVSIVGVFSALMALQLERSRELAVYRTLGMTPLQVGFLVIGQSGLMGLMAGLLSLPVGLVLAGVLVHIVNLRAFGWTMELVPTPEVMLQALVAAVIAALAAGLVPAWRMARTRPALVLREE